MSSSEGALRPASALPIFVAASAACALAAACDGPNVTSRSATGPGSQGPRGQATLPPSVQGPLRSGKTPWPTPLPPSTQGNTIPDQGNITPSHLGAVCPPPPSLRAHSLVVFGNLHATMSDVEGRVAVLGDAQVSDYSIGAALPVGGSGPGVGAVLTVFGHLRFLRGRVAGDLSTPAVAADLTQVKLDGRTGAFPSIAFEQEAHALQAILAAVRSRAVTAEARVDGGGSGRHHVRLPLRRPVGARDPFVHIARFDAWLLAGAHSFSIEGASDADFVVVDLVGTEAAVSSMGFDLGGVRPERVAWMLPDAVALRLDGVGFPGSVVAPRAAVSFSNGVLLGSLVAGSFEGTGQINAHPLDGHTPLPCPAGR